MSVSVASSKLEMWAVKGASFVGNLPCIYQLCMNTFATIEQCAVSDMG